MKVPIFDCAKFKKIFSIFEDTDCEVIEAAWDEVIFRLPQGICMSDKKTDIVWRLITAHILYRKWLIEEGDQSGLNSFNNVSSSSAGDTSVSYNNPMIKNQDNDWKTWLKSTAYGIDALVILEQPVMISGLRAMTGCLPRVL